VRVAVAAPRGSGDPLRDPVWWSGVEEQAFVNFFRFVKYINVFSQLTSVK
jgi:hypothetical protein